MNTEPTGYVTVNSLDEYLRVRHGCDYDYNPLRGGLTISLLRLLLQKIDRILGCPHRAFIKLLLKNYLQKEARRDVIHVPASQLYQRFIFAVDLWTNVWVVFHLFAIYPVVYYACQKLDSQPAKIGVILLLIGTYIISLFRAADILTTLARLHLAESYIPHSSPRAVVGTICQFLDITITFANTYLILRVFLGQKVFGGASDLLRNPLQSLYYSFVTITTLGYGDTYPTAWPVQFTVILQLLTGLILIVIIFQHVIVPRKTRISSQSGVTPPSAPKIPSQLEVQDDLFFANFLDRFRHEEVFVKELFQRYVEVFRNKTRVLDLACGRGEFLEVMQQAGIEAYGIDENSILIKRCKAKGLNVRKQDWREHLNSIEDESLGGLFSAQFIEHLPYHDLIWLVRAAFRKLKPDGVLVLETLMPCLNTMLQKFYVDFTHRSLINPQALSFLFKNAGFDSVEVLYYNYPEPNKMLEMLSEDAGPEKLVSVTNKNFEKIQDLIFSPHYYAVVGRR